VLKAVGDVREVDSVDASEAGEGVATFRVLAGKEVRADLCRALVQADIPLLGLSRTERELESVFLELSRSSGSGAAERRAKRKRTAKARNEALESPARSVPPPSGGAA
jgi:hypothetical protein